MWWKLRGDVRGIITSLQNWCITRWTTELIRSYLNFEYFAIDPRLSHFYPNFKRCLILAEVESVSSHDFTRPACGALSLRWSLYCWGTGPIQIARQSWIPEQSSWNSAVKLSLQLCTWLQILPQQRVVPESELEMLKASWWQEVMGVEMLWTSWWSSGVCLFWPGYDISWIPAWVGANLTDHMWCGVFFCWQKTRKLQKTPMYWQFFRVERCSWSARAWWRSLRPWELRATTVLDWVGEAIHGAMDSAPGKSIIYIIYIIYIYISYY